MASVNGLLITTDEFGRYHIACDAVPDNRIGSNYILKLDEKTLPTGYSVTSENPRVVRLTQGKIAKLNFAAARLRTISLALSDASFEPGSTSLSQKSLADVARVLPLLDEEVSLLQISYQRDGTANDMREGRLKAVRKLIEDAWDARSRAHRLFVEIEVR